MGKPDEVPQDRESLLVSVSLPHTPWEDLVPGLDLGAEVEPRCIFQPMPPETCPCPSAPSIQIRGRIKFSGPRQTKMFWFPKNVCILIVSHNLTKKLCIETEHFYWAKITRNNASSARSCGGYSQRTAFLNAWKPCRKFATICFFQSYCAHLGIYCQKPLYPCSVLREVTRDGYFYDVWSQLQVHKDIIKVYKVEATIQFHLQRVIIWLKAPCMSLGFIIILWANCVPH